MWGGGGEGGAVEGGGGKNKQTRHSTAATLLNRAHCVAACLFVGAGWCIYTVTIRSSEGCAVSVVHFFHVAFAVQGRPISTPISCPPSI